MLYSLRVPSRARSGRAGHDRSPDGSCHIFIIRLIVTGAKSQQVKNSRYHILRAQTLETAALAGSPSFTSSLPGPKRLRNIYGSDLILLFPGTAS